MAVPVVCGLDEAGRGPLAGRVYAAAVILPDAYDLMGLTDSKLLTARRRATLAGAIRAQAAAYAVAWTDVEEIESLGIDAACFLAMRRAAEFLSLTPDEALADGRRAPPLPFPCRAVVGGDRLIPSISAASILAKTERDAWMCEQDAVYPAYGFSKHKGYGTRAHFDALERCGPCPLHRQSFLRKWRERQHGG